MSAPVSAWDNVIKQFAPLKEQSRAIENAAHLREWLAYLAANPGETVAFDAGLDDYARQETALRAREEGRDIPFGGGGYIFLQYTALYGPKDQYWPECVKQIDRRQAARGLSYCKWRGVVRTAEFSAWRHDGAAERARLPHKHERIAG